CWPSSGVGLTIQRIVGVCVRLCRFECNSRFAKLREAAHTPRQPRGRFRQFRAAEDEAPSSPSSNLITQTISSFHLITPHLSPFITITTLLSSSYQVFSVLVLRFSFSSLSF